MNVKDSIKKVGAVAASTLMVGMTMGAAQSLGEFPGMFVDDEGSPTAQVVVGSQGAVSDVVGAVNVAAALGQATIQTSEQTETVDVETSGGIGWSASDGQTLDTSNTQLYFGDSVNDARSSYHPGAVASPSSPLWFNTTNNGVHAAHRARAADVGLRRPISRMNWLRRGTPRTETAPPRFHSVLLVRPIFDRDL